MCILLTIYFTKYSFANSLVEFVKVEQKHYLRIINLYN